MVLGSSKNLTGSTRFSNQVVTADEIPDIYAVDIKTFMNGQMTQNNSTRNLINSFGRIISFFSNVLDLTPGTVITTGTPGGTGWGQDKSLGGKGFIPPGCVAAHYLRPGDEVRSVVQERVADAQRVVYAGVAAFTVNADRTQVDGFELDVLMDLTSWLQNARVEWHDIAGSRFHAAAYVTNMLNRQYEVGGVGYGAVNVTPTRDAASGAHAVQIGRSHRLVLPRYTLLI
jgi:hypothetical protein